MDRPAARMALAYALLFGASGVSLPFAPLWFRAEGLSGPQIGLMLAAPMLGRVITGPLIAVWADGFGRRRTAIALLAAVMAAGYGASAVFDAFPLRLACWFLGATAAAGALPLIDVLTLRLAARGGFHFAWVRSAGSVAFVLANVGIGAWLLRAPPVIVAAWLTAAALMLCVSALWVLPPEPVRAAGALAGRERFRGVGRLLADPVFMTTIFAVGAVQAAHAFQYAFSALLWKAQGIDEAVIGLLWALGVGVEILLFWVVEPWRRRVGIGPWTLLAVGCLAAIVRWIAMGFAPPLEWLWPLQALHALTFAATFLAGVQLVERLAPEDSHTAAQTLSSVLSAGLFIGLATLASGALYARVGAQGYWAMAVLAALGLVAALIVRPKLAAA